MQKIIHCFLFAMLLFLASCTNDWFANNSGPEHILSGIIYTDCNKNAVLRNAEISLIEKHTGYEYTRTMTDENGYFSLKYQAQPLPPAIEAEVELRVRYETIFGTVAILPIAESFIDYDFIDTDVGTVKVKLDFEGTYTENG